MNFASHYAGRVLIALAATTALIFSAGCGSGSSIGTPNSSGFSKSSLTGTYVFSSSGEDASAEAPIDVAGTLVADGNGNITGGTVDVLDPAVTPALSQAVTGSYSITSDGRGRANVNNSTIGTFTFDFVLTSSSHGLVTEFDGNGTGSGTLDIQAAVPTLTQLAGPYAFSVAGVDSALNPLASVGAFTLNSGGTITAGVEDFNDAGSPTLGGAFTGTVTAPSGTAPGSITLNSGLTFDFFPIDSTHLKLIETDFAVALLSGDAFTQTGASIPSGPMAFTLSGGVSTPIAAGGTMTSDGTGNFTAGLEDVNVNGAVSSSTFTGASAAGGSVGGRVLVNLTGFVPATQLVIYPFGGSAGAGLLMMETDFANVNLGTAYAQTSTTIAASQGYGFNLSAFNTSEGIEEDDIAQFNTTSSTFAGVIDINDDTATNFGQSFSGNYTAPDTNGHGSATTTENGNTFVSFNFYVVNSSTVLLLETDQNQIGTGTFEMQSSSAGPALARQAHMSIIRPAARSHVAFRHKN